MSKNNKVKTGNVKDGTVVAGDNNKIIHLIKNFIYKGLSAAELEPIVKSVLEIARTAVRDTCILAIFALILVAIVVSRVEITGRIDFQTTIVFLIVIFLFLVLGCIIIFIVRFFATYFWSKAYVKALVIILMIPFCMAISIVSASYLLDEPVKNIIDRIVSPSDENQPGETGKLDDIKPVTPKPEPRPTVTHPDNPNVERPDDKPSDVKPEALKPDKPIKAGGNDSTPHVSYSAKKQRYSLRSYPIEVSQEEFKKVFGLNKNWRPLEYIQNEFEDNRDGTITDHATGLMWQKSGSPDYMNYENAKAYIDGLNSKNFAGYSDWRLPTVDELKSLLTPKEMNGDLYINPIFDKTQWWCWTSDTTRVSGGACYVDFYYGSVNWGSLDGSVYVRAVRLSQ